MIDTSTPTLPELYRHHQTQHPKYCNPLASFDPDDEDLQHIKREALLPYLEDLEEKMIVYKECMVVFAVLFEVETDEEGFRANVWRLNPIYVPQYAYPLADRKLWTVSCQWRTVRLLEDRINCMPFGWTFWPEERVVSQIEHKFMKEGRKSAHLALRHSANL